MARRRPGSKIGEIIAAAQDVSTMLGGGAPGRGVGPSPEARIAAAGQVGEEGESEFIGVPEGFLARPPTFGQRFSVGTNVGRPTFRKGDETAPLGWAPRKIATFQRQLVDAGLLLKPYRAGRWDAASAGALEELMAFANSQGHSSIETALAEWQRVEAEFGGVTDPEGGPGGGRQLTIQVSDPVELKRVFRRAVVDMLGQGWDEGRLDQMVTSFQDTERAVQQRAFEVGEMGGEFTGLPDPAAFAEEQIREQDPIGVQSRDLLGRTEEFLGLLRSPV